MKCIYGFQTLNRSNNKNLNSNSNLINNPITDNSNNAATNTNQAYCKTNDNVLFLRKPVKLNSNNDYYFGYWNSNGEMEGYGIFVNNIGQVNEGYWSSKGETNLARIYYKNGTYYEGNVKDYLPSGKGILYLTDSEIIYDGEWLKGFYDKEGKLTLSKFCSYEGNFKNSAMNGKGKLTYKEHNGQHYNYNGVFENGKFHGEGTIQFFKTKTDKPEEYSGLWVNGFPYGKGIYTWKNGNKYEGNYELGKKKGQGKYVFNLEKNFYEGAWSNGKPNGKGVLVMDNPLKKNNNDSAQIKISGVWKVGKAQKIDSEEEFKKINNDESKLSFLIETEFFFAEFNLKLSHVTTSSNNVNECYNDPNNGKIIFQEVIINNSYNKGLYGSKENQNVISNNVIKDNLDSNNNMKKSVL